MLHFSPVSAGDEAGGRSRRRSSRLSVVRAFLHFDLGEPLHLLGRLLGWVALGAAVGVLAGVSSAVFLTSLARVTDVRGDQPWLLAGLPVGGFVVGLLYHYGGGRSSQGTNLILDAVHDSDPHGHRLGDDGRWVPRRMAPLVLFGTLVTHLFGGSAGREGTAIQMSGSLSDGFARLVRLPRPDRHLLLVASIAGGFGAVFGVPLAGAVFALEVQTVGRIRHDALVPALTASIVGDRVVHLLDWPHDLTPRIELAAIPIEAGILAKVVVAGLVFGLVSALFSELVGVTKRVFAAWPPWPPVRPLVGGILVVLLALVVGNGDYLGLSLPLIEQSLTGADVVLFAFLLKLVFTTITLGSGFQGGEVTPLFVIGATLGASVDRVLDGPPGLLAAVGLVAVFAGATNTPLACTVMGLELFGPGALVHLAIGCTVSFVISARRGIYEAQRLGAGGTIGDRHDPSRRHRSGRRSSRTPEP